MTTNTRLLQGSLQDFSLIEILQMMELGSTTGAIRLKQPGVRSGILYFQDGKMSNCTEQDPGALTLGDVLQQLGMATSAQIEEAFAQQLSDPFGMRIGERLMAMGVIHAGQLKEALRTKALWTARELALWKDGSYEFITGSPGLHMMPYGEESFNLEVMRVTMEMVRYTDEWEQLVLYLPQGMRTQLQMAPAIPYSMSFDAYTLDLLIHVNLRRQVRRTASAMRRPELEIARDLAQLVQQRLVQVIVQETGPFPHASGNGTVVGRKVRLPDPAEKLRMESFELLNLISRMEQEWYKRRTPMEQLPALAEFVNWTMDALAETCRERAVELDPNTLITLLQRESLRYMGNYEFKIDQNHIDVDNFTALCYEVLSSDIQKSVAFYEEASKVLQNILRSIFQTINARVASLDERLENQEVWETMFFEFSRYEIQQ